MDVGMVTRRFIHDPEARLKSEQERLRDIAHKGHVQDYRDALKTVRRSLKSGDIKAAHVAAGNAKESAWKAAETSFLGLWRRTVPSSRHKSDVYEPLGLPSLHRVNRSNRVAARVETIGTKVPQIQVSGLGIQLLAEGGQEKR